MYNIIYLMCIIQCGCDLMVFINEAKLRGHLCITVQWIIQYLSMMDPQAPILPQYNSLLGSLVDMYR